MTGVMIGHDFGDLARWDFKICGQPFRNVLDLAAERVCTLRPRRIAMKQMVVFLESRSAARRVDDDRVHLHLLKNFDVPSGALPRTRQVTSVRKQCPATSL